MSSRFIEIHSFTVGLISGLAIRICFRLLGLRSERSFGSTNTEDKTGARSNLNSEELNQIPFKSQAKRKRVNKLSSDTVGNCGLGDAWADVQIFDSAQGKNLQSIEQLSWKTNALSDEGRAVTRWVHCCDALAWIKSQSALTEQVITSLPDICELPDRVGNSVHTYCEWFKDTCEVILQKSAPSAVVIFYQSDFKRDGFWVDKSHLCNVAAERAQSKLLWHKIVCINAPGTSRLGRPTYTHMLAFSKQVREVPQHRFPSYEDVLASRGQMAWPRAMGLEACTMACKYAKQVALITQPSKPVVILDPFCGKGSVLAVANQLGMDSIGVELSKARCKVASTLRTAKRVQLAND